MNTSKVIQIAVRSSKTKLMGSVTPVTFGGYSPNSDILVETKIEVHKDSNLNPLSLDVRYSSKLESPLAKHGLVERPVPLYTIRLSVAHGLIRSQDLGIRPVRRADFPVPGVLLPDQIILAGVCNGHIAGVYGKPVLLSSSRDIVVGSTRVPYRNIC